VINAMSLEMIFDYVGIRLNGPQAAYHPMTIGLAVMYPSDPLSPVNSKDPAQKKVENCAVLLRNGVLVYQPGQLPDPADATYVITRDGLNNLALGQKTPQELLDESKLAVVTGTIDPLNTFNSLLETFNFAFPLTTP